MDEPGIDDQGTDDAGMDDPGMNEAISRPLPATNSEWQTRLSPEQFFVLREAGTEAAFSGKYYNLHQDGTFRCAGCGSELFSSEAKFDSGCGWPSFTQPHNSDAVELLEDRSHGMVRTEVRCRTCGGHLGHVFDDGPAPKGERWCINSTALDFQT